VSPHGPSQVIAYDLTNPTEVTEERGTGSCPICARPKLTVKVTPGRTFVNCYRCRSAYGYGVAGEIADFLEITLHALLSDPFKHLAPWLDRREDPDDGGELEPLPRRARIGRAQRLFRSRNVQRRLWQERGVQPETFKAVGGGFDPICGAWMLPVQNRDGELVNVTWRPPKPPGYFMWHGSKRELPKRLWRRTAENGCLPIWPDVPPAGTLVLLEGEWDVLAARQAGIAGAITGLRGVQWDEVWNSDVVGRDVVVCYDVGYFASACRTEKALDGVAASVRVVDLDLPEDDDDVELFLRPKEFGGYGGTAGELFKLLGLENASDV
jgi:hypothetical protein